MSHSHVGLQKAPGASASVFVGTFGIIMSLVVFLFVFDTFLARIETADVTSRAESAYAEGQRLVAAGKLNDAADRFLTAAAMDRSNHVYTLAAARTLLMQHNPTDAEQLLNPILQADPTDGRANVLMARVLVAERRFEDATSYYHRAIYGRWRPGEGGSSMQARFELIDLLARTNARQKLLAELLPIQDQSLDDRALRDRIGRLFLMAGSPERASEVFRQVLSRAPADPQAYAGLGEAALALGNYPLAAGDLARAAQLAPHDSAVGVRLDLARALIALDPAQRGLQLSERYERSRRVVQLTIDALNPCVLTTGARAAVTSADSALHVPHKLAPAMMNDAVEENLALSQRLWALRPAGCAADNSAAESALALLQEKLAL